MSAPESSRWWALFGAVLGGFTGGTLLGLAITSIRMRPLPTGIHRVAVGKHVTLAPVVGSVWKIDRWNWDWQPADGVTGFNQAVNLAVTGEGEGLDVVLRVPGVLELEQLWPNDESVMGTFILATPGTQAMGKG